MKQLAIILISFTLFACPKSPEPDKMQFDGKYMFSVKDHEVGNYGAMDFLFTFRDQGNRVEVKAIDEFNDDPNVGTATVDGDTFTIAKHIEDKYDTRNISITVTNKDGFLWMVYDVEFTQASGDFHWEGNLIKQ